MTIRRIAAFLYAIITLAVVAFQIALAAGAPWCAFAMGGAFPGQFPPAMRIAAIIQAALLIGFALVVLARTGIILPKKLSQKAFRANLRYHSNAQAN